ncbi:MAG: DUF3291 domain-containing protein [Solirubrobacteraceae bacterium]
MTRSEFHIAQVNVGLPVAPVDSPPLAEFVALLDPVNALADRAPGFVWRLQTEEGNATSVPVLGDDRLIVNMSVWESIEQLADFVYRSDHVAVIRRRREWFQRIRVFMALWWVPVGHVPTVNEAEQRLEHLRANGPTHHAFTFRQRFPAPGADGIPEVDEDLLGCPA